MTGGWIYRCGWTVIGTEKTPRTIDCLETVSAGAHGQGQHYALSVIAYFSCSKNYCDCTLEHVMALVTAAACAVVTSGI